MKKIVFVGGGSAGHIFPIVALIQEINKKESEALARGDVSAQLELHYIGEKNDLKLISGLVKADNLYVHEISAGKINRYLTWKHFPQAVRFAKGLFQARGLIAKIKPNIVFAKGGYVSVPVVLAAQRRNIPIYGHETDVVPGMANRLVAKYAEKVFTAFPGEYYKEMPTRKLKYVGQPVREEFFEKPNSSESDDKPLIVVIGGSQGAKKINDMMVELWKRLLESAMITQITGMKEYEEIIHKADLQSLNGNNGLVLQSFSENIPDLFQKATLVISRSGGTIFEIAASGVPSILIPLSTSAQNHQLLNARVFEEASAAIVLDEDKINSEILLENVLLLLRDNDKRKEIKENVKKFACPNAVKDMLEEMDI